MLLAGRFARGVRMLRRNIPLVYCRVLAFAAVACAATIATAQAPGDQRQPQGDQQIAGGVIPYERLTSPAATRIRGIVHSPTLYRRLPTQAIDCDPKMFIFLVRNPEVLVGIWQRMDVSQVQTRRLGPYQLAADDKAGTECTIDLVYGDATTHVFLASGSYTGTLAPRPITGNAVFVLQSRYAEGSGGRTTVTGTLDCFIQLDSLGADLVARTLSGLIGRTADHNFIETARFVSQVSQASEHNPSGMHDLALELHTVEPETRRAFATAIVDVARRAGTRLGAAPQQQVPFVARREK